ncbi:S-adenosylmethionine:tRNA ribosyltransferase-isomerase [Streptomyces laurentii]|uniref:S-adenosylmethionine:tRNA ribosyltransferase-isomerase n=1 Tax=Streptomyces laurentii TaxID=39478 RepID=A0A169N7V1_STRLU|nr:S-adenosylmethionine:tRNA ribosyltransferase-isomerase [Streptomyces laurentii]
MVSPYPWGVTVRIRPGTAATWARRPTPKGPPAGYGAGPAGAALTRAYGERDGYARGVRGPRGGACGVAGEACPGVASPCALLMQHPVTSPPGRCEAAHRTQVTYECP